MAISDIWKTDEYYRNLAAIKETFPGKRYLTYTDVKNYLGVSDNRVLKEHLGMKDRITAESLRLRLIKRS